MGTTEFKRLAGEILKARKSGWTTLSKDVIRLQARKALESGAITQEEYDRLIEMLDEVSAPPPPGFANVSKNKQGY